MTNTIPPTKRGRPRKFDRHQGLKVAGLLFRQQGYDGLGVAQLCSELNITPTSLYGTYNSKFQLFAEVLESYKNAYVEGLKKRLAETSTVPEVFRSALEYSLQHYTENSDSPGCLILDSGLFSKEIKVVQLINNETANIHTIFSEKLEHIEAKNASELASIIVTLLKGLSAEARSGKSEEDLYVTVEFLCTTIGC